MGIAATVLLVALAVTSAVSDGREPADLARPIAVLVAGVLAWRRAPFVVVVLAAAGTAAGLRLLVALDARTHRTWSGRQSSKPIGTLRSGTRTSAAMSGWSVARSTRGPSTTR